MVKDRVRRGPHPTSFFGRVAWHSLVHQTRFEQAGIEAVHRLGGARDGFLDRRFGTCPSITGEYWRTTCARDASVTLTDGTLKSEPELDAFLSYRLGALGKVLESQELILRRE